MVVVDWQAAGVQVVVYNLFRQEHSQSATMDSLRSYLETNCKGEAFTDNEITASIDSMSDDNMIMVSNDIIFLIQLEVNVTQALFV